VNDLETGAHAFAETKEEHDRNVAEFRRMRDEAEAEGDG
jgi:cell division protein YceG involved in septum cleavage